MSRAPLPESEAFSRLVAAAREFVRRVEAGEIRSRKSYAAFKDALLLVDEEPPPRPTSA